MIALIFIKIVIDELLWTQKEVYHRLIATQIMCRP